MTGDGWRQARERAGMTLRRLADAAGISPPFLSDVEHGRRKFSAETESKVRAALGLPPRDPEPPAPRCVVCEGPLTRRTIEHGPIHDPHGVIGPSYQPIAAGWTEDDGFTCRRCGLHYDAAPGNDGRTTP